MNDIRLIEALCDPTLMFGEARGEVLDVEVREDADDGRDDAEGGGVQGGLPLGHDRLHRNAGVRFDRKAYQAEA